MKHNKQVMKRDRFTLLLRFLHIMSTPTTSILCQLSSETSGARPVSDSRVCLSTATTSSLWMVVSTVTSLLSAHFTATMELPMSMALLSPFPTAAAFTLCGRPLLFIRRVPNAPNPFVRSSRSPRPLLSTISNGRGGLSRPVLVVLPVLSLHCQVVETCLFCLLDSYMMYTAQNPNKRKRLN